MKRMSRTGCAAAISELNGTVVNTIAQPKGKSNRNTTTNAYNTVNDGQISILEETELFFRLPEDHASHQLGPPSKHSDQDV